MPIPEPVNTIEGDDVRDRDDAQRRTPDSLPRSPTGRIPQWVIDEANGHPAPPSAWRHSSAPLTGTKPTRQRRGTAITTAILLALAIGLPFALNYSRWASGVLSGSAPTAPAAVRASGQPAPSTEEAQAPLGTAEPLTATSTSYAFLATQSNGVSPIAYDPCRPIHYVVRPDNEPPNGQALIDQAIARISRATGLVFVNDGATSEAASRQRPATSPDRYGDRWSPVLIAWETHDENPDLATDVLGEAGSTYRTRTSDGVSVYVTGQVELDAQQFADLHTRPGGDQVAQIAILHELGHLVGLDHVNDPTQVMYPETTGDVTDLAAGDLTGLAALGRGACLPGL